VDAVAADRFRFDNSNIIEITAGTQRVKDDSIIIETSLRKGCLLGARAGRRGGIPSAQPCGRE
jgi:hypothetical protein